MRALVLARVPSAWPIEGEKIVLKRMLLLNVVLAAWCTSAAWGRAEFHIGGPTGTSWQGLITDEQTEYAIVDGQGEVLSTLPIAIGAEEAGVDTMIAYDDNAIRPIWVDPSVNLALDVNLTPRGGNLFTSVSTGYTREAAKEVQVMIDGDPRNGDLASGRHLTAPSWPQYRLREKHSRQSRGRDASQPHPLLSATRL